MTEPLTKAPVPPPLYAVLPNAARTQRIALLAGLAIAAWLGLKLFSPILLPFVIAGVIAYVLDPPASRLTRLGIARGFAALLLILALMLVGLFVALLIYPLILSQIGLLLGRLPLYALQLQAWAQHSMSRLAENFGPGLADQNLRDLVSNQAAAMLSYALSALPGLIGGGVAVFNVLLLVVVTPVLGFYLLRDWPRMVATVDSWTPRRYVKAVRAQAREVDRVLSAWVRGQALCCIILALFYIIALQLVRLEFGLIIGLTAGLLSFIPYVGSITGGVTSLALAAAQFPDWRGVSLVALVLVIGHALKSYVIYPRYLGDRVELPAVWVIFALFAGGLAFGFLGVLLAVPMAATIGVLCRFWLRRYLGSPLYVDPEAPRETPP
ncbi:MAG: AI-2E family transporter [Acetobacteraceae bacterium]|nr:AI-2E family transporter [Acetobacteraceae bacterium]